MNVGDKTEAIILAALVRREYKVLLPFGNSQRYDLVLDTPEGFVRVQCKTGRLRNGKVIFHACSINNYTGKRKKYDGEADMIAVHCYENDTTYLVPVEGLGSQPYLRVEPPKNGQVHGIRWASSYELPVV